MPHADAPEAALEGIDVYPVDTLGRLVARFRDYNPIEPYRAQLDLEAEPPVNAADFQDIKGQIATQKHQFAVYCDEVVGQLTHTFSRPLKSACPRIRRRLPRNVLLRLDRRPKLTS